MTLRPERTATPLGAARRAPRHASPRVRLALAAAVALLAACGSTPPPTSEIALSESALRAAELAGARQHAPIELRAAEATKARLDEALADEDYDRARRLAEQARAEAELAKAKAESEKSRLALDEVEDGIRQMRREVDRAGSR